ncbi:MAG: tryptophan--tRNA ligase [Candidatus Saccharibacteria bacterium]|nr:tryptophan--tRNA ligase [Candidatus Saccharibacteria bacterium]
MKTILTGIRANSELHIGHYFSVIRTMARLVNERSNDYHVNIFVPDLHSIISEVDGDLQANIVRSIKCYLAAGLKVNPNVYIYRQSYVPAHSELCWILNCVATMGEMSRMTQYKDKSEGKESCNVGIFDYPVLMAADILLYSASYVPVGEDQFQHIELARNLAMRFNHRFGEVFVVPVATAEQVKFMGVADGVRIRNLVNPEKKMSKSAVAENSKIMLSDSPEQAKKKIMLATTDSYGKIAFDMTNQPGISNLLQIEALITGTPLGEVVEKWAGETRYGELKKKVAEGVAEELQRFQAKMAEISDAEVYRLFEEGERYANEVAGAKLLEVQRAFGLR